jgi:hypothetical protein
VGFCLVNRFSSTSLYTARETQAVPGRGEDPHFYIFCSFTERTPFSNTHYAAVKAGVTLPWSSGPVEGHINHLKMLKRQMFGRARLDLLSYRFVLAPRDGQAQASRQRARSQAHAVAA